MWHHFLPNFCQPMAGHLERSACLDGWQRMDSHAPPPSSPSFCNSSIPMPHFSIFGRLTQISQEWPSVRKVHFPLTNPFCFLRPREGTQSCPSRGPMANGQQHGHGENKFTMRKLGPLFDSKKLPLKFPFFPIRNQSSECSRLVTCAMPKKRPDKIGTMRAYKTALTSDNRLPPLVPIQPRFAGPLLVICQYFSLLRAYMYSQ